MKEAKEAAILAPSPPPSRWRPRSAAARFCR